MLDDMELQAKLYWFSLFGVCWLGEGGEWSIEATY